MQGETRATSPRTSHEAYVRAIVDALADRGVQASELDLQGTPVRAARMTVAEHEPSGTHWDSASVRLLWDERNGWAWQVRYAAEAHPRAAVHFGTSVVPAPGPVADWMLISLVHPNVVPSRDDELPAESDLDDALNSYSSRTS